jgi:hypothetical protein
MKRTLALALGLALVCGMIWAEVSPSLLFSATATSQTQTLAKATPVITIYNAGANEVYVRIFQEGDTPVAAVANTTSIYIGSGASLGYGYLSSQQRFIAVSAVCSAAETATVHVYSY